MDKKGPIKKYMALYMSLGMCFGVPFGLLFGMAIYPDNRNLGMCFGIPIGMCIGAAIGSAKDKKLSEKIMQISRIEVIEDSTDVMIYVIDKNGAEKEFRVTEKVMNNEKFSVDDRVSEVKEGSLVSLECK